ncbi:MAG TPA: hypothetical protein VHI78_12995, partial [Bacteroidales bacterium]|nr:hypothetical protein [Bacteroidales bacterium]
MAKTGGLKFASKDVYSSQRTSLKLFDNLVHAPRSFDLKFTCDIYNSMYYGFVFRILNDFQASQAPLIHLIYIPPQGNSPDCSFEFHFFQSQNPIIFQLDTLELRNISFEVLASVRENSVRLRCNDQVQETVFEFPRAMNINFLFGLHGENTDVAPMILHNIRLTINNQNRYFWPLNEFSGNSALERFESIESDVVNPIWLQNRHYKWEKLATVNTDPMAGIVFDNQNNLLIINKDSLLIFNPANRDFQTLKYNSPRPFDRDAFFSVYDPKSKKIIGYDFHFLRTNDGRRVYSVYDPEMNSWTVIDSSDLVDQNHHHSTFWNQDTSKLITFGGYSYFRYYNTFKAFDFDSARWEDFTFSGDEVYPRTHSAVSRNRYTGKYYLYGGFGNKEGSQSMEGRYFYDLYEVIPGTHTIRKIWNLNAPEFDFVPRGNLVFNPDAAVCYVLGNQPVEKSNLRLYEISLESPQIKIVSDSIPVIFSDMSANAYLFHNRDQNELYCVT